MTASTLPPTHLVDAPGAYIVPSDPAWDHERFEAELAALKTAQSDDGIGRHPLFRYFAGRTRYQLDAADWTAEGKPCVARDFLRPGATPAVFTFVRPNRRRLHMVDAVEGTWERRDAWIRAVVRRIDGPATDDLGRPLLRWEPASDGDEVPDAILEALHQWNPAFVRQIADACALYCRPLQDHEGKR